jgi:hypothetical protein
MNTTTFFAKKLTKIFLKIPGDPNYAKGTSTPGGVLSTSFSFQRVCQSKN